jgi:hypothetical protein
VQGALPSFAELPHKMRGHICRVCGAATEEATTRRSIGSLNCQCSFPRMTNNDAMASRGRVPYLIVAMIAVSALLASTFSSATALRTSGTDRSDSVDFFAGEESDRSRRQPLPCQASACAVCVETIGRIRRGLRKIRYATVPAPARYSPSPLDTGAIRRACGTHQGQYCSCPWHVRAISSRRIHNHIVVELWLQPQDILPARFVELGMQFDL